MSEKCSRTSPRSDLWQCWLTGRLTGAGPSTGPQLGVLRRLEVSAMAASGQDRIERRLAAILAADVAGYSRLTGVDEEGTHVQLQDHLRTLVDPKIAEHRGRVFKTTGAGVLAAVSGGVDAVDLTIYIQSGM